MFIDLNQHYIQLEAHGLVVMDVYTNEADVKEEFKSQEDDAQTGGKC